MKAEELMLGDWVFDEQMGIPVPVCSIREGREYPCRPIPLTPEILEKNGFKDVSNHTLKGCDTYELVFGENNDQKIIYKLGDYFQYWSFDDRWYKLFETQICHKWCVHNLQHCLKLCGIKKEFKL